MFSGCAVLQKLGLQKNDSDELYPASSIVMNEDEAKKLTDKVPIHLYFASEDSSKLKMEVRYIPVAEAKKSVNNLASVIVKELIKGPAADTALKATIPATAQLRAPVNINAGVATVDFTKDFVDKHPGGKSAEQLTIYSIVNSLTELKEVQKVKFLINGKAAKDFKGNFQFDQPFPRSANLISKATEPVPGEPSGQKAEPKKDDPKTKTTDPKQQDPKKDAPKTDGKDKLDNNTQKGTGDKETANPEVFDEEDEATYLEILE